MQIAVTKTQGTGFTILVHIDLVKYAHTYTFNKARATKLCLTVILLGQQPSCSRNNLSQQGPCGRDQLSGWDTWLAA